MIIGSAMYFPLILDDRTDSLQTLKNTMITLYVLSFGFAATEAVFALRCVYAHQFERLMESQIVEISPLMVGPSQPFVLAASDNEKDGLFSSTKPRIETIPDVQTFLCRTNLGFSEEGEAPVQEKTDVTT